MARKPGSKVACCSSFSHPALATLLLAVLGVLGVTLHTLLNRQNCLEPRSSITAEATALAASGAGKSAATAGTDLGAVEPALRTSQVAAAQSPQQRHDAAATPLGPAKLDTNRAVFWLHIPKTGTSIANSFYRLICPAAPLDDERTYDDNALFKKFPPKEHCQHHWLPEGRTNGWHWPLTERYSKTLPLPIEKRVIILTMFREPAIRLASSYEFGRMFPPGYKGKKPIPMTTTLEEYARLPGLLGCQTRMVLGYECGSTGLLPTNAATTAFERVIKFDFFGITEAWFESVNLLHVSLGMPDRIPRSELGNMRPGKEHKDENAMLRNLLGELGEPDLNLYPLIRDLFLQRLKLYGIEAPVGL